jgi:hypothetical protein
MTQFHEGQEVEVVGLMWDGLDPESAWKWRKAKILYYVERTGGIDWYEIEFANGTRGVFETDHIRALAHKIEIRQDSYSNTWDK